MEARLNHVQQPSDIFEAKRIRSVEFISEVFVNPNPRFLHFVVEIRRMNAIISAISGFKT